MRSDALAMPEGMPRQVCPAKGGVIVIDGDESQIISGIIEVNGISARAIIDTGFEVSSVDKKFAERAGIYLGKAGDVSLFSKVQTWWAGPSVKVRMGRTFFVAKKTSVWDFDQLSDASGYPIDFVIGRDIIRLCDVSIDFDNRTVRFFNRNYINHTGRRVAVANVRETVLGAGSYSESYTPIVMVNVGGQRSVPLELDTGSAEGLEIVDHDIEHIIPPTLRMTTNLVVGLTGANILNFLIIPQATLGEVKAHDIETFAAKRSYSTAMHSSGSVGVGVLRQFNLDIDLAGNAMWLSQRKEKLKPPIKSTSGLLFRRGDSHWDVVFVMLNSPADKNGWKANDKVCAVDGEPISPSFNNSPNSNWTIGPVGRINHIVMCDGSKRELISQEFY